MTAIASAIIAIAISVVALTLFRAADAKRARSARTAPRIVKRKWWITALLCAPGAMLVTVGNYSGLICWIAALTVSGWLLARTADITRYDIGPDDRRA